MGASFMRQTFSMFAATVLMLALCALSACESYTCEGACGQYYLGTEGNCGRPSILGNGTQPEDAFDNCVDACTEALYNTANESNEQLDSGNRWTLSSMSDAEKFINCVAEQDYSEAAFNQTCADLDYTCTWFRW
jgi:hypothetical protein